MAATQASPGSGEAPRSNSVQTMQGPSPNPTIPDVEATASGASKATAITKEPVPSGDQSRSTQSTDPQVTKAEEQQMPVAYSSQAGPTQVGSHEGEHQVLEAEVSAHPDSDAVGSGATDKGESAKQQTVTAEAAAHPDGDKSTSVTPQKEAANVNTEARA